ncbi:keratin, type I cytoskeletal 18-like [Carettochelys insculpta]|uniref:keratin, type I cytoskeletal 18-like n=1 Tax=Carettochelys insculpta TaxID=44489 RepID=UPI003EBBDA88
MYRGRSGSLSGGSALGGREPRLAVSRLQALLPGVRSSLEAAGPASQQEALQGLNERLAGYLGRVRGLEAANQALEEEIAQRRARRQGAGQRDWAACERPLAELRKQVEDLNMDNAKLLLQIDNARLAADDFKLKLEAEQAAGDSVQKDTQGLRRIMEDTSFQRTKLDAELEGLKEELAHLRKSHQEEAEALRELIASSDVTVEVDNPQKQDLSKSIAQIRQQYEKVADQNRLDMDNWYKNKFDVLTQEANVNTQALEDAKNQLAELRRQLQGLELERQSLQKMVDTLQSTLRSTESRYDDELAKLNRVVAKLQEELAACRADLERQAQDYADLLDLKSKLEEEIGQYKQLIEGVTDGFQEAEG